MPDHPTITGEQRDALYDLVCNHLSGLDDVCIALRQEDFATAERLAQGFGEDFRLLADLGWSQDDSRETVELTMPTEELIQVLKRLRAGAANAFVGSPYERKEKEEDEEVEERYRIALSACDGLLTTLASREGDSE